MMDSINGDQFGILILTMPPTRRFGARLCTSLSIPNIRKLVYTWQKCLLHLAYVAVDMLSRGSRISLINPKFPLFLRYEPTLYYI